MDILYLLIPLSAVLVLAIIGVFGWALTRGQFEDLEHEGERILQDDPVAPEAPPPDRQEAPAVSPASDVGPTGETAALGEPPVDVDQARR